MRFIVATWFAFIFMLPSGLVHGQFAPDSAHYIWPTEASPYLSGTFGETRSQHFHSALDIKTWGVEGYRVFATREGTLHRISITRNGYGKAVYLKHPDGSYSIYAHLLTFSEQIQQLADEVRLRDYSFEIDLVVDSLDIRIGQGQVIGLSGSTGVGPPHLHFELRTPSGKPFNPLLTNLSIHDDIPPRFSTLSVEPLGPESHVEGQKTIFTKRAATRQGYYDFGTVEVTGPVGLGVDLFDMANEVTNAYAVYDLKLYMDEELLFHSRVDSFSYDETRQMYLDRVYPILRESGRGFQRLYLADGNNLPFYRTAENRGRLDLAPGSYALRIVAEDFFGNRSTARLTLNVSEKPVNGPNGMDAGRSEWVWHADWIDFRRSGSNAYFLSMLNRRSPLALSRYVSNDSLLPVNRFDFVSILRDDDFAVQLYRVTPGEPARVHGSAIDAYATFPAGTFYDTLSVALTGTVFQPDSVRLQVEPMNQPVRNKFELTYIADPSLENDSTLAFYAYDPRRDKLVYVPSRIGGVVLKGEAPGLGTYYVLRDTTAPRLSAPRVVRRADGKWIATLQVLDPLTGVDPGRTVFEINGVRGIAEFEPEDNRIIYYHPDFSPQAQNRLRISVTDYAGNTATREFMVSQ